MPLVQWNRLTGLAGFDRSAGSLFNQVLAAPGDVNEWGDWTPAVDVYETSDHELVVSAELPGIDLKDVEVTIEEGVLTIAGERKIDSVGDGRWYRNERSFGAFRRSFTVPRTVDTEAVSAEHKDGTLSVRLPLKEDAKPHRIAVRAA